MGTLTKGGGARFWTVGLEKQAYKGESVLEQEDTAECFFEPTELHPRYRGRKGEEDSCSLDK